MAATWSGVAELNHRSASSATGTALPLLHQELPHLLQLDGIVQGFPAAGGFLQDIEPLLPRQGTAPP